MDRMGRGAFGIYKMYLRDSIPSVGKDKGKGKDKDKVLPRTGHEGEEGE
jgi:hypothetical protein